MATDNYVSDDLLNHFPYSFKTDEGANFRQYMDAHQDEIDAELDANIQQMIASHQIDNATGSDLDRIGALFGSLGERDNRTDTEYRQYLKSLVNSFNGQGTIPGIKLAIGAGLNADPNTIKITEYYDTLENKITITQWDAHQAGIIQEMFNVSKPSVVTLREGINYPLGGGTAIATSAGAYTGNQSKGLGSGAIGDATIGYYE